MVWNRTQVRKKTLGVKAGGSGRRQFDSKAIEGAPQFQGDHALEGRLKLCIEAAPCCATGKFLVILSRGCEVMAEEIIARRPNHPSKQIQPKSQSRCVFPSSTAG